MKLAIVGIWFDGYYDLWIDFLRLFNKYWKDCPYPLYVVDISKDIDKKEIGDISECRSLSEMHVIKAGEGVEYSKKIQTALSEIDADYFLLVLEDFFIGRKIDSINIEKIMNVIEKDHLKYYQMPLKEFQNSPHSKHYRNMKDVFHILPTDEYTVTAQPSIWRKDFLKECIGKDNYNAWIFEGMYIKSKKAHTDEFCDGCVIDNRNVLNFYHGALQGKIVPDTYEYFKKIGYEFYNEREVLTRKAYGKHKFKMMAKRLLPLPAQKLIKSVVKTDSIITKYENEINEEIARTIGE